MALHMLQSGFLDEQRIYLRASISLDLSKPLQWFACVRISDFGYSFVPSQLRGGGVLIEDSFRYSPGVVVHWSFRSLCVCGSHGAGIVI